MKRYVRIPVYRRRALLAVSAIALLAGTTLVRATPAAHAAYLQQNGGVELLTPGGPLAEIDVSTVGTIQVYDNRVCAMPASCGQFYDYGTTGCAASVGVAVQLGGQAYGPGEDDAHFNCNYEFNTWHNYLTPISQAVAGNSVITKMGLPGNPFAILTEIITYYPGMSSFQIYASLSAPGKVFIGGEEDPGNNEEAYNYRNPATGAVGGYSHWTPGTHPVDCDASPSGTGTTNYYLGEVPLAPAQHWLIGNYDAPNAYVNVGADFPDLMITTGCNDLGFGLEWLYSVGIARFTFGSQAP